MKTLWNAALVLLAWALIIALSPLLLVLIAWDGLGITVTRPYPPAAPRPAYVPKPLPYCPMCRQAPCTLVGVPVIRLANLTPVLPRLPTHRLPDDGLPF